MVIYDLVMRRWVTFFEEVASPSKKKAKEQNIFTSGASPSGGPLKQNSLYKNEKGNFTSKALRNSIKKVEISPHSISK